MKALQREALEAELLIQEVLRIRKRQKRVGTRKLIVMLQPFLKTHNIHMGRDAFFELLADNGLLVRRKRRRFPRTTFSGHHLRKYRNLIIDLPLVRPNQLWVSDITFIFLEEKPAYLSLVTDAYSRMIVGYHLHKDLSTQGCIKALNKALKQLPKGTNLIHHSDRGCQYCSFDYVERLSTFDIAISMTQHGDPRENAIAERVNGIIKQEFLEVGYMNFSEASEEIKKAIYIYNYERLHSSIGMMTPFKAHSMSGDLKRHWKTYYKTKPKEVTMT